MFCFISPKVRGYETFQIFKFSKSSEGPWLRGPHMQKRLSTVGHRAVRWGRPHSKSISPNALVNCPSSRCPNAKWPTKLCVMVTKVDVVGIPFHPPPGPHGSCPSPFGGCLKHLYFISSSKGAPRQWHPPSWWWTEST